MNSHTDDVSLLVAGAIGAGVATLAKGLWDSLSGGGPDDYYKLYKFHEQQHKFHERQHTFYKNAFFGLCCLTAIKSIYPDLGQWGYYIAAAYVGYYAYQIVALHLEGV